MANERRKSEENSGEIDLTPMLDVVFIMLIFFIVTASFIKEPGAEIIRPDAVTAEKKPNAAILVAVTGSNEIWYDKRRIDERLIRATLEQAYADNPKSGVVVQADEESSTETVVAVIDAARAVGIFDVTLSTD